MSIGCEACADRVRRRLETPIRIDASIESYRRAVGINAKTGCSIETITIDLYGDVQHPGPILSLRSILCGAVVIVTALGSFEPLTFMGRVESASIDVPVNDIARGRLVISTLLCGHNEGRPADPCCAGPPLVG